MREHPNLVVLFELSDLAKSLEEKLNISWGLEQKNPFDNTIYLRVCDINSLAIKSKNISLIKTGLYIQITEPDYEMRLDSYSNILRKKNIGIISGSFDSNYRNEIVLIAYNYGDENIILEPGEIVGKLQFNKTTQIDIKKIYQISTSERYSGTKDHNWVQEDKRLINNKIAKADFTSEIITEPIIKNLIEKRLK
jgi:dUTPase